MKKRKLLYLHGFTSSPQSYKAELLSAYMQVHHCRDLLEIPQIPEIPGDAGVMLKGIAESMLENYELSIIGSSLGGYYATWLAEKYTCPAVLVNPAVRPYEVLEALLGENKFYFNDKIWDFDESHILQFRKMDVPALSHPENFLVLLQTGDETLNYRQAAEKYRQSKCIIEQGGEHGFSHFEKHIKYLLDFCQINCNSIESR